jgi:hypothetical protein
MYRIIHTNVDGSGTIGEFVTLAEAIEAADKLQNETDEREGNPYGYRYHVYQPYGRKTIYSTRVTPEAVRAEWRARRFAEMRAAREAGEVLVDLGRA